MKGVVLVITAVILVFFLFSYYSYSKVKVNNANAEQFKKDLIEAVSTKKDFDIKDVARFRIEDKILKLKDTSMK
ncbi:hypothetical protein NV379_17705 [Paenibacillus sp. N1-5-1-14]|uniref:hypothetical protein n=1 Tax=Paenibacillus radicibacter TaxID=2972488 RepID=UPI002158A944|nr:hypothetical protein [Paenibacillus radicibacter]MCR8644494.1 hypothetical protein [Paenibacillus radicibacter]